MLIYQHKTKWPEVQVAKGSEGLLPDLPGKRDVESILSPYSNYIYAAVLFPISKAEALNYLDGVGPKPGRFARIVAVRGASSPPDVTEYKVIMHCHLQITRHNIVHAYSHSGCNRPWPNLVCAIMHSCLYVSADVHRVFCFKNPLSLLQDI